jgi:hypothetical protein
VAFTLGSLIGAVPARAHRLPRLLRDDHHASSASAPLATHRSLSSSLDTPWGV